MEAALHPQAFGQILTRIWQLMRANIRLFIEIGAPPVGVMLVMYALMLGPVLLTMRYVHRPINHLGVAVIALDCVAGLLFEAILLLAFALYEPAASYAGLALDAGRTVTFREAYGAAWSKAGRYFWLQLLRLLIVAAPMASPAVIFLVCMLGMGLAKAGNNPSAPAILAMFIAAVLYLAGIVWAILAAIRLVLAFPVCVTENLTAWEAVRRSNRLSEGGKLRIFLIALVLYAVSYGVTLACELAFGIVFGLGAIVVLVLQLGPAWSITGIVLLGICFMCVLLLMTMCLSSSYSVAFAILYRQHVRLEAIPAQPGVTG